MTCSLVVFVKQNNISNTTVSSNIKQQLVMGDDNHWQVNTNHGRRWKGESIIMHLEYQSFRISTTFHLWIQRIGWTISGHFAFDVTWLHAKVINDTLPSRTNVIINYHGSGWGRIMHLEYGKSVIDKKQILKKQVWIYAYVYIVKRCLMSFGFPSRHGVSTCCW